MVWLAKARASHEWQQTAEILAVLYNANRDPKKKGTPWQAKDFNPYHEKPKVRLATKLDLEMAKAVFSKRQ